MGITTQQFEQLKRRMSGPRRESLAAAEHHVGTGRVPGQPRVILGVDPSLRGTGYGVIRFTGHQAQLLAEGTIKSPASWVRSRCLLNIAKTLREVIQQHQPTTCAIEGLFFAQNLQTALIMGEARGAALAVIAEFGLEIFELAPRKVKQAIVGYGAAQKIAVAKMVQRMLALPEPPAPDAADALALALTFAQESGRQALAPLKPL